MNRDLSGFFPLHRDEAGLKTAVAGHLTAGSSVGHGILVRLLRLIIVHKCMLYNIVRCKYTNVSRSPLVRVVVVRVPRSKLVTNPLFLTRGQIRL